MKLVELFKKLLFNFILLAIPLFATNAQAESIDTRPYKISVLIFKHLPADKDTFARMINRWSDKNFDGSTLITRPVYDPTQPYLSTNGSSYDILLPAGQSALAGSYRTLSHDPHYSILFNGAWVSQLQTGTSRTFHFNQIFDDNGNILDGLIKINMKFYFDIDFQTQLLTPKDNDNAKIYKISALNEHYQTSSNQLQYIDSPNYGALVLITRYNGK
ncbi:MAG: hypothetical protein KBD83_03145 [Gammaproteobacteria bacterium]|nr:hypothetical protein [Gammaproteobacteria bacterium]